MAQNSDLKNVLEEMALSCEDKIQNVVSFMGTADLIFSEYQEPLLHTKLEREKINTQLRDILAQNEHLRKKDFDNMMQDILLAQGEREQEARDLLKNYFNEQQSIVHTLRYNLTEFKDALSEGEVARVKEFQPLIKEIVAEQDERKKVITSRLKEFQNEQQEIAKRLKGLLAKGRELRIKDLKLMLKEFKIQHKERIAAREVRRQGVNKMLGEFKKSRLEIAKSRTANKSVNDVGGN